MKTTAKSNEKNSLRSGRLTGLVPLVLVAAGLAVVCPRGWAAPYRTYDNKDAFLAGVRCGQIVTQNFGGLAAQGNLNGTELLPGVTVTSSFASLVIWHDGSLFGFDDSTRLLGKGSYEFRLAGYNAVGFDVMAWDPAAPGPAKVVIQLQDGTAYEVEWWQNGPTESTPVFFGVIAEQPITRIQWNEGPEVYGGGNEEVSLDNLLCARAQPCEVVLQGIWEPDAYTGHASRLVIRQEAANWYIHGYGACSPTSCDWGEVILNRVHPYNAGAFDGWFAVWEFGFVTTYVWLSVDGEGLKVESIEVFHDDSGRQPYSVLSRMHHVRSNPLTMTRRQGDGSLLLRLDRERGARLQRCTDLTRADWVDVALPEGVSEHVVTSPGPAGFFRLVTP
jgi:hypothetical protein